MALDVINAVEVIETMENYIARTRPPEKMRPQLDINYRIENQSIFLFEIRPDWQDRSQYRTRDYAKITYDKKNDLWKIFWMRANLKWYTYDAQPTVKKLIDFLKIVDEDKFGCFKG